MFQVSAYQPIALVTFDLYDTLVEAKPPRWERFAIAAGRAGLEATAEQFKVADHEAEDFYTVENGGIPIRDRSAEEQEEFRLAYTAVMLRGAGQPHDPVTSERVRAIYRGELDAFGWNYRVFNDVEPALSKLADAGVQRAIISNADADVTAFCLHLGFAKHIDLIVTSALVGWEKPDPRTYHAALDPLGVDASAAIHIGDQALSDVVGAEGVGAALIDRYERQVGRKTEAIRVGSLEELTDLVIAHNAQFAVR